MSKRIIVAFDGSELSREAFGVALSLAKQWGGSVFGLHVVEPVPPPIVAESVAGVDAAPALADFDEAARKDEAAEREHFENEFRKLREKCGAENVPFDSAIEVGLLIPALVDLAAADDVIAIGMKGRFSRAGLGSSARSLIKKAPCPVLVASGAERKISRVLGVFDGTSVSKRAVDLAQEIAAETKWPLSVLAVEGDDLTLDESMARAKELAPDADIVCYPVKGKSEAEQIERACKAADDAILVMGAYSDSWLHQLFFGFGGTTAHVLSHVGAPVILVH